MYNRYISNDTPYKPIQAGPSSHGSETRQTRSEMHRPPTPPSQKGSPSPEGIIGRLGGLLKSFHSGGLDSGDILLVLILLFLFLESDDNLELVITLGLLLLFGLFGNDKEDSEKS